MILIPQRLFLLIINVVFGLVNVMLIINGVNVSNIERFFLILALLLQFILFIKLFDSALYAYNRNFFFYLSLLPVAYVIILLIQEPHSTTTRQQPSGYTHPTVQPLPTPGSSVQTYVAYSTQVQQNYNRVNSTQPPPATWPIKPASACTNWAEVSMNDYGKTMCVEGIVLDDFSNQGVYYITFGKSPNDFYVLSYDFYYTDLGRGDCVQVRGEVRQIGQAPVIAIADPKMLTGCP